MPAEEEGAAVPAAQRGSWSTFIKSIASVSGDLSSLTAPPFILSPTSLTEFPAYWLERPDLFAAIADAKDDEDRSLRVLKWFISTLKSQYTSRSETMGSEKKPLNPVLGELFYGSWPDNNGRGVTELTVEQVSHHPPITAYYITNKSKGLTLQGHSAQKTSFSTGSIFVKQVGHAILTVRVPSGPPQQFLINFPKLRIDGLWYGSPYTELTETSYIQASSGWTSTLEYRGKGYFSGKSHTLKAVHLRPGSSGTPVAIEGTWNTICKVTDGKSQHVHIGDVFTDVNPPKEEVTVKPISEQGEWETRKLWANVAKGIREGDYELASREKSKIENEQRQRRKDEAAAGTPWQLIHFVHVDVHSEYETLAELADHANPVWPETEDAYLFKATNKKK